MNAIALLFEKAYNTEFDRGGSLAHREVTALIERRCADLSEQIREHEIEREVQRRLVQQPRRQNDAHSSIDMDLADDPGL